jgi:hypothetical protein
MNSTDGVHGGEPVFGNRKRGKAGGGGSRELKIAGEGSVGKLRQMTSQKGRQGPAFF